MTALPTHYISQSFVFEAAHSLRRDIDTAQSLRLHGHSYQATITLCGTPDAKTGFILDLGDLRLMLERLKARLDHRLLDDMDELGPATLENLCSFMWRSLENECQGLHRIKICRPLTGDSCMLEK